MMEMMTGRGAVILLVFATRCLSVKLGTDEAPGTQRRFLTAGSVQLESDADKPDMYQDSQTQWQDLGDVAETANTQAQKAPTSIEMAFAAGFRAGFGKAQHVGSGGGKANQHKVLTGPKDFANCASAGGTWDVSKLPVSWF